MKKTFIAAMFMLGTFTSFSRAKSIYFHGDLMKNSTVKVEFKNIPMNANRDNPKLKKKFSAVYEMFLMNDGCYHLYILGSHIDYTGMLVQGWEMVDPAGYTGTTSVCLYASNWESLC